MIAVDEDILEMSDDGNQTYEWKLKVMKCVTYKRTSNVSYADNISRINFDAYFL